MLLVPEPCYADGRIQPGGAVRVEGGWIGAVGVHGVAGGLD